MWLLLTSLGVAHTPIEGTLLAVDPQGSGLCDLVVEHASGIQKYPGLGKACESKAIGVGVVLIEGPSASTTQGAAYVEIKRTGKPVTPMKSPTPATMRVVSQEQGDLACYLHGTIEDGSKVTVMADFSVCEKTWSTKRVALTYTEVQLPADDCNGNPECTRTRMEPIATGVLVQ